MSNRTLIHIQVSNSEGVTLVPIDLHWMESDMEWIQKEESHVIWELSRLIAENLEDIEKKAKSDGNKQNYKRLGGSTLIEMAYATAPRGASAHCVIQMPPGGEKSSNILHHSPPYSLISWVGPNPKSRSKSEADGRMKSDADCKCTNNHDLTTSSLKWPIECGI
mmetsp:Transcript_24520/g.40881  ORF Transcript_24520/g.40881 Transcript_24520/m.40881 type:complete len:164 (-) Transcript_24520:57-548(-)